MLNSDDVPPVSLGFPRKGASFKIPDAAPEVLRVRSHLKEKGLANWVHYHPECERPLNWKWASCMPAFGRLVLSTVHDLSEPGGIIASRSTALTYQTWTKPFFLFMSGPWLEAGNPPAGVDSPAIPVAAFTGFKSHINERVAATDIASKSGYAYKGAITRILKIIWDDDPTALGPGWTERTFVHDDFVDDFKQREPYSAAETRRLLDAVVKFLQETVQDGRAERPHEWLVDVACYVAVALRLGIETECLDRLAIGDITASDDGASLRLRYIKKRAPSNPRRTKKVQVLEPDIETIDQKVGTLKSAGGILALMLRRAALAGRSDKALLWQRRLDARQFADFTAFLHKQGLRCDKGETLPIARPHFRVTYKTAQNIRHKGMLPFMPEDNTRDVNSRHYLESERMMPLYEQAIENAANEALAYALEKPKVITLSDEATDEEIDAVAAELGVAPPEVAAALRGETDVWISSCRDFYNSPFDPAGTPCSKSFFGCLGCRNALITRRVLPRLLRFYSHITVQRTLLDPRDWEMKFGLASHQISEEILPRFPRATVEEARIIAQGLDAALHLPPEITS